MWPLTFFYLLLLPTAAVAVEATDTIEAAVDAAAAETALQYSQGAGIRTQDSATADKCATNASPYNFTHA